MLQPLLRQFPTQINRERIAGNSESLSANREFHFLAADHEHVIGAGPNILPPSLPTIGASLYIPTAATTQLITVFLGIFALGQLAVVPLSNSFWPTSSAGGSLGPTLVAYDEFLGLSIS